MATTTNYGWTTPDDTALVKDGAAAIRSLGTAIDNSFAADEGDLLVGGTSDIFEALPIGAAGTVLTSDGDTAEWAAPAAGGGMTLLSTTTASGATTTISSINSTYKDLIVDIYGLTNATGSGTLNTEIGNSGGGFSYTWNGEGYNGASATALRGQGSTIGLSTYQSGNSGNFRRYFIPSYSVNTGSKVVHIFGYQVNSSSDSFTIYAYAGTATTNTVDQISFSNSGGSFTAGTIKVYGVN